MVLYALHDATVKLMPGQSSPAPSLAETWSASEDQHYARCRQTVPREPHRRRAT
jgi:hypothetical protein